MYTLGHTRLRYDRFLAMLYMRRLLVMLYMRRLLVMPCRQLIVTYWKIVAGHYA